MLNYNIIRFSKRVWLGKVVGYFCGTSAFALLEGRDSCWTSLVLFFAVWARAGPEGRARWPAWVHPCQGEPEEDYTVYRSRYQTDMRGSAAAAAWVPFLPEWIPERSLEGIQNGTRAFFYGDRHSLLSLASRAHAQANHSDWNSGWSQKQELLYSFDPWSAGASCHLAMIIKETPKWEGVAERNLPWRLWVGHGSLSIYELVWAVQQCILWRKHCHYWVNSNVL